MSISLFEELDTGGYQASLMTTYSIDFPFYEDLLLKKMQSKGISHHVLLADKRMCQSVVVQRPPKHAGKQYSLGLMEHSQAFHPKVIMLLGKKKGLLVVGSHNVTLSGFGKNLEISNVIRFEKNKNEENLPLFVSAFNAFNIWLNDYGNSTAKNSILDSINDTLKLCSWLKGSGNHLVKDNLSFLFTSKSTVPLWQQFQPYKPSNSSQIIATTPFFDKSLDFTKKLLLESGEGLLLGVQPQEVVVSSDLFELSGVKVVDNSALTESDRYIHAKAIFFEAGEKSVFISGSANLSSTAWLNDKSNANAEAVLVRIGIEAIEVSNYLGITALNDAGIVSKIDRNEKTESKHESISCKLAVMPLSSDGILRIEIQESWGLAVNVVYIDEWKIKHAIDFSQSHDEILVKYDNIKNYGVITVLNNDIEALNIIVHKVDDIKRLCTTGSEQKIQEAWGSLNTEHPDIKLLFNCLDKLSCFDESLKMSVTTGNTSLKTIEPQATNRDLIVSLVTEIKRNPKTGKIRGSQGDIAHVLDVILYCLYRNIDHSNDFYGEDKLGRNEEDLIGSDDESDDVESLHQSIDEKIKVAELCRKKLKAMVRRLIKLLKQNDSNKTSESLLSSINATLVVISILPPLEEASEQAALSSDTSYDWVTQELCEDLLNAIFEYILIDKSIPLDLSAENKKSVYSTDEVNQLLSHVVWLLYKLGYVIKPMPPLSMIRELGGARNLQNSRLLYVFQRLIYDSSIEENTVELFEQYTDRRATLWLKTLQHEVEKLVINDEFDFCTGYGVVSSLNAFEGYRFSISNDDKFTTIASTKQMEEPERILTQCLEHHA